MHISTGWDNNSETNLVLISHVDVGKYSDITESFPSTPQVCQQKVLSEFMVAHPVEFNDTNRNALVRLFTSSWVSWSGFKKIFSFWVGKKIPEAI